MKTSCRPKCATVRGDEWAKIVKNVRCALCKILVIIGPGAPVDPSDKCVNYANVNNVPLFDEKCFTRIQLSDMNVLLWRRVKVSAGFRSGGLSGL
jgi:hypothetical protein